MHVIQGLATTDKLWAFTAPARVGLASAVSAALSSESIASRGPVSATTGTAYIMWGRAVTCHVSKLLTFGAAERLLLVLVDRVPVGIDADALLEKVVSRSSILYLH